MKSPIKDLDRNFQCLSVLKDMIPKGSIVNSFLFFAGAIEFNLAANSRFVCAHTNKYVIYEFWDCLLHDHQRVYDIVTCESFNFRDENIFNVLQESWPKYRDPYVRASLFFLLNRCSATGKISSGKLDQKNFNPIALSHLKRFKPLNFHLIHDNGQDISTAIDNVKETDYLLFPIGAFRYDFLNHSKSQGYETELVDHRALRAKLKNESRKWLLVYNFHPELIKLYKGYNMIMVDRYGRRTLQHVACKEIIIANF